MKTIMLLILIFSINIYSQNKEADFSRIVLNTYIEPGQEGMSSRVTKVLENKLNQIAIKNGVGGDAFNPRFIITAKLSILTKDITPTVPPMHALTIDVNFFIGDGIDGIVYGSTNMSVKGVGKNESKAFLSALKNIKTNNPEFKVFVNNAKQKIIDYYNNNCELLLKEADAMVSMNQFDEAIEKLIVVPNVSSDCYNKCMTKAYETHQTHINLRCKVNLAEARNIWNTGMNYEAAIKAKEFLSKIDPNAKCYNEALAFSEEIAKRIKEIDQREWDFKMKKEENTQLLKQQELADKRALNERRLENESKELDHRRALREQELANESKRMDLQKVRLQNNKEIQKAKINALKTILVEKYKSNSKPQYKTTGWGS